MTDFSALIKQLQKAKGSSNELDIACEIAMFEPDGTYSSVRANSAGTKVIYTKTDGTEETHWAQDWSMARPSTITLLRHRVIDIAARAGN